MERHRTMLTMLADKGKASSPLKTRQRMMQTVNADVKQRMSMLMDSVGYGNDGEHLSAKIIREGNMAMDNDMSGIVGENAWLQEAEALDIGQQPWEVPELEQDMYRNRNPILPGIDDPSLPSAPRMKMSHDTIHSLPGAGEQSLEQTLGRWNELGKMVDAMTSASKTLAKLDRKRGALDSQHPVGSRLNPSEKALELRRKRRNSRSGDPEWEAWGGAGGAA